MYHVYILASQKRGTLYTGVTNNLARRVHEHRNQMGSTFARKYGVTCLVYAEEFPTPEDAIVREKRLKKWNKACKIELIEGANPEWRDLWFDINR